MQKRLVGWYARAVAQRILVNQRGSMDKPETWVEVARRLGCRMCPIHEPGGMNGEYRSAGEGIGVIVYNTAITPPAQARVIVHELSHHLLMALVPGDLFEEWHRASYDDNAPDCRHAISQAVETICFRKL